MERRLLTFFGPAQLGDVGKQPDRSESRTAGVGGQWELRRNTTGRTYLVPAQEGEDVEGERASEPSSGPVGDR